MTTRAQIGELAGFPALSIEGDRRRPLLLFLHGAFTTHTCMEGYMRELARVGFRGVAPSRSGRLGVGSPHAAGLRVEDYVRDTIRVIEALGELPIVVGHSLGGLIAQRIAELGHARGAVLLAPAPAAMLTAQPVALPALLPMMPRILAGKPVLPACSTCETIALNCVPKEERAEIHAGLVHESGIAYREMIFGSVRVDPAKVRVPVLVVGGLRDRIVSRKLLEFTARRYGADLRTYPNNGHWLLQEPGWEAIAADVAAWLEQRPEFAAPRDMLVPVQGPASAP